VLKTGLGVLKVAPPTSLAHMGTPWRNPSLAGRDDLNQPRPRVVLALRLDFDVDLLARKRTGDEDHAAVGPPTDTVALFGNPVNMKIGHTNRLRTTNRRRRAGMVRTSADMLAQGCLVPGSDRPIEIAPSILPADFSRLGDELQMLEKASADRIHWDIMDGTFVPNLTIGPDVVASCRDAVDIPFEAHLMVDDPDLLAPLYISAGCELITIHVESTRHLDRTLSAVIEGGARAAVTLNPATPLESIENVLHLVDMVLIMSVNPGFGGQKYIRAQEAKIRRLHSWTAERGLAIDIEVDGGISAATIADATAAGGNVFVAGSAVFGDEKGPEHAITNLRALANQAR
jgi:ribulose-phosphate 3-epimerase